MKKILVLGATGRIGKLLLPMLEPQENAVTAYVRSPEKAVDPAFEQVSLVSKETFWTPNA